MITSHDILAATGLKNTKTLTRWHQQGIIPEPMVRTHPSGRGKLAYWPDWVLDHCVRIVELQREGHSLQSAAKTLRLELIHRRIDWAKSQPNLSELLHGIPATLSEGTEGTLLDSYLAVLLSAVKSIVTDVDEQQALLKRLREANAVEHTLNLARGGYNPVLLFNDEELVIVPDFVVSQRLCEHPPHQQPFVVAQLLPALFQANPSLKEIVGNPLNVMPAPKVWVHEEDATVEYLFYPGGTIGFELIRETAKVISGAPKEVPRDEGT